MTETDSTEPVLLTVSHHYSPHLIGTGLFSMKDLERNLVLDTLDGQNVDVIGGEYEWGTDSLGHVLYLRLVVIRR
jgi:hypothetical protein